MECIYGLFLLWGAIWMSCVSCLGSFKVENVDRSFHSRFIVNAVPDLDASEYTALQELYDATNGPSWTYRNSTEVDLFWNFDGPHNPCAENWLGVNCTCSSTVCNVQILFLYNFNLTGSLPDSISSFTQATALVLSSNFLSQSIPDSLGTLQTLEMFVLADNDLSGTLPDSLFTLHQLVYLDLSGNYIAGRLPPQIGLLSSLTALILDLNEFTNTIPDEINELHQLQVFQISDNHLNGTLPNTYQNVTSLNILRLSGNKLSSSLPDNLGYSYPNLNVLQLDENQFTGSMPASIGECTRLYVLAMNTNQFGGSLPLEMGSLENLYSLDLFENNFVGQIPYGFARFDNMTFLRLYDNHFTGSIPAGINNMKHLKYLQLNLNSFSHSIPSKLFQLSQLVIFDLSGNQLTGSIPSTTTSTTSQVQYLFLYSNQLEGSVPSTISSLTNLKYLDMSKNVLSNSLPSLSGLENLLSFDLRTNLLTSSIPDSLCGMTNIRLFDLHENVLSGTLPTSMGAMQHLQNLFVHDNVLSGSICSVFNATLQRNILNIDFSNNQFTGNLPVEPFLIASLQTFAAASNCLLGAIPIEVCSSLELTDLVLDGYQTASSCRHKIFPLISTIQTYTLSNDKDYGNTIPECLFSLPKLQTLHLSGNGMTGTVPSDIVLSKTLTDLSLSHNVIKGTIPEVLMVGTFGDGTDDKDVWLNLDLSYNRINGILAESFPALTDEQTLSLQVNRLSGVIPRSLKYAEHITMLDGNIFSCHSVNHADAGGSDDGSELPVHDEETKIYECGSNSFNQSVYLWVVLFGLMMLCIGAVMCATLYVKRQQKVFVQKNTSFAGTSIVNPVAGLGSSDDLGSIENTTDSHTLSSSLYKHSGWVRWLFKKDAQRRQYLSVFSMESNNVNIQDKSIYEFGLLMSHIRRVAITLTIVIMVVFFPLYSILTRFYSTYEHEYAYFFSMAFLSGTTPAVTMFFALMLFILLFLYLYNRYLYPVIRGSGGGGAEMNVDFSTDIRLSFSQGVGISKYTREGKKQSHAKYYSFVTLLIIANCIVVIGINVLYVYISLNYNKVIVTVTQVALAMFKLFWNSVIVFDFFQYLKRIYFVVDATKSQNNSVFVSSEFDQHASMIARPGNTNHRYERKDILVQSFIVMFNNIASPCLAIAVISSNCFYNAFFLPPSVNSSYQFEFCTSIQVSDGTCLEYVTETHYTTYLPPFIYSYQCSSIFITNYATIYVYLFVLTTFGLPLLAVLMQTLFKRYQAYKETVTYRLMNFVIPEILKPLVRELPLEYNALLQIDKICVIVINSFGILITFGALFPPLAVVICVSMVLGTYTIQLLIGKVILNSSAVGYSHYQIRIEEECYNCRKIFQHPLWLLLLFCSVFYAIFLSDMLGDAVGFMKALWAPLCMCGIPVALYFLVFLYRWATRSLRQRRKESLLNSGGRGVGGSSGGISGSSHGDNRRRSRSNSTGSSSASGAGAGGNRANEVRYHIVNHQGSVTLTPVDDDDDYRG